VGVWKTHFGAGDVPLNRTHTNTVMFVCHEDVDGTIQPIGTGSLLTAEAATSGWWPYLVTANHLVRDGRKRWIRFRRTHEVDGEITKDIAVDPEEWVPHSQCDIAAVGVDLALLDDLIWAGAATTYLSPHWPGEGAKIVTGQTVNFIGLLGNVPSMVERNIPMTRGGTIGALFQEDIPVVDRHPSGERYTREEPIAHLIDCYSRSGFSGSPTWATGPRIAPGTQSLSTDMYTTFIGVIVGHFGDPGDNAGIAVAVPSEAVHDLLDDPRLVTWRNGKDREMNERKKKEADGEAAQLDQLGSTKESEFERFEDLAKRLVHVPKPELDDQRKTGEGSN
jgi:hypothetical protein